MIKPFRFYGSQFLTSAGVWTCRIQRVSAVADRRPSQSRRRPSQARRCHLEAQERCSHCCRGRALPEPFGDRLHDGRVVSLSMPGNCDRDPAAAPAGDTVRRACRSCSATSRDRRRPRRNDVLASATPAVGPDRPLGHRSDGGRVDLVAGFGAAGPGNALIAGKVVEVPQRHLGAASIVRAQEEHGGLGGGGIALTRARAVSRGEPPQRSAVAEGSWERLPTGELVVGECKSRSMVSTPKCSPNSECSRVAAVRSGVAGRWTDRGGGARPGGRDCRSCRTPLIGVMGVGGVRDDDIVGSGGAIRVEGGDERQSEECSDDLGGDKPGAEPARYRRRCWRTSDRW